MKPALVVFAAVFTLDLVWAVYTLAIADRDAILASSYAGLVIVLSGIAQIGYTKNKWLLIPACIGAFAGTYIAVRLG